MPASTQCTSPIPLKLGTVVQHHYYINRVEQFSITLYCLGDMLTKLSDDKKCSNFMKNKINEHRLDFCNRNIP